MTEIFTNLELPPPFPDHTQLPEEDGTFVKNFQEHPQSIILTDSLGPILQRFHPDFYSTPKKHICSNSYSLCFFHLLGACNRAL